MPETFSSPVDFSALDALLWSHRELWQPAPFRDSTVPWMTQRPDATQALLSLDEDTYQTLRHDDAEARRFLTPLFPEMAALGAIEEPTAPALPEHFVEPTHMAGRKAAQVCCFCNQLHEAPGRLLEWCAGQGWLLEEALRRQPGAEGIGLERTARLCQQGNTRMASRGIAGTLEVTDVMRDETLPSLQPGDTLLALHACGHLHQQLVRWAVREQARGVLLSPCCYHLGERIALSHSARHARLPAHAIDPHLAVQDITTGHSNRSKRQEKAVAWRLGYDSLRQQLMGDSGYRPLKSMPGSVWQGEFSRFCELAAAHHGLTLPPQVDWAHWLAIGEQRRASVRRLELVRRQYRRLLEWWLVLDAGMALAEQGYRVSVAPFCEPRYTPRNLLISAWRDRP